MKARRFVPKVKKRNKEPGRRISMHNGERNVRGLGWRPRFQKCTQTWFEEGRIDWFLV